LVELIIVIAIMAILIGVLAPQYIKYVEKSRVSSDQDNADNFLNAAMTACTDEEYIDSIGQGDTVTFSGGAPAATGSGLGPALDEYFANWSTASAKSKSYKSKTYTVTISADANSALKASGAWN
jgi:type IV pilus assembly protein PilA